MNLGEAATGRFLHGLEGQRRSRITGLHGTLGPDVRDRQFTGKPSRIIPGTLAPPLTWKMRCALLNRVGQFSSSHFFRLVIARKNTGHSILPCNLLIMSSTHVTTTTRIELKKK